MAEALDLDALETRALSAPLAEAARIIGTDVPALVAEVRALRARVEAVREVVDDGPWFTVDFHGDVLTVDVEEIRDALEGSARAYNDGSGA